VTWSGSAKPDGVGAEHVVVPGFESVRAAFDEVLAAQGGGAACAAIVDGTVVCDLWGGTVGADSLVHTWSVIKPVSAACLLLAARRSGVSLETPVADVWPELRAAREHRAMTVAAVLAHRGGLVSVPRGDVDALCDLRPTEEALEAAEPDWPPGSAAGEHALTYGHVVGGLLRRIDGRSLGAFLADEVAARFDLDVHIGLSSDEVARAADLEFGPDWWDRLLTGRPPLALGALGRGVSTDLVNGSRWRRAEVAAVNGHATARGMARFWWLAMNGELPGELLTPFGPNEPDVVLGCDVQWTLGSAQVVDDDVGMGGVGGSFAGARLGRRLAWAFLTTVMGTHHRVEQIEAALLASIP
jgi:CubicO group peptidase (beta-lactamase class C family)